MNHQNENDRWAQDNGYGYHAETEGTFSEGARELDVFRKANGFRNHVTGTYRNRSFEILDVRKEVHRGGNFGFVERTVILIPAAGLDLPNFELLPRREAGGLGFLGFPLLFMIGKKFFLLIPVLALVGAALGNWIGKRLMRSK